MVASAKPGDVRELLRRGSLFPVDFWVSWCAPCAAMEPYLWALAERLEERGVPVLRLDVDDEESREYARARPGGAGEDGGQDQAAPFASRNRAKV
jgi:thiol-disulfide isomerase/thioredoxin